MNAAARAAAHAHAIHVDALTLEGQFLKAVDTNKGGRPPKTPSKMEGVSRPKTRSEQGVGYKESSDAQALADVKEQAPATHARVRAGES